jgi:hypothetical protein
VARLYQDCGGKKRCKTLNSKYQNKYDSPMPQGGEYKTGGRSKQNN